MEENSERGFLRAEMVERFAKIWSSQGTRTRMDVTFYRPLPSPGFHILGDIVRPYIADFPKESSFPALALVFLFASKNCSRPIRENMDPLSS